MVKIESAFKWVVVAVLVTAVVVGLVFNHSRLEQAREEDPVGFCIRDRLIEAQELKSRAHDILDEGRWDEGQRLLAQAWSIERNMTVCMDLDETIDLPGPDAE